jgi:hypothetical protein
MLDNIGNLSKILNSVSEPNKAKSTSTSQNAPANNDDNVSLSSDAIDLVKKQAETLRNNLSSIIANFILEPVSDGVSAIDPTQALLNQVTNPGTTILQNSQLSPEQLTGFKDEVKRLEAELPRIISSDLLAPIGSDATKRNALNGILQDLSSQLTGLSSLITQKEVS